MNHRIAIRILAAATVVFFAACEKKAGQPIVLPSSQDTIAPAQTTAPSTVQITKKLNGIIFPKIDFRDSTVREAVEFLVQKSKTLDPDNQGVNIVLKLGGSGVPAPRRPVAPPPVGSIPGLPGLDPIPGTSDPDPGGIRITLTLNNVPMLEVIKYITNLANLKYKVEPSFVQIVPRD